MTTPKALRVLAADLPSPFSLHDIRTALFSLRAPRSGEGLPLVFTLGADASDVARQFVEAGLAERAGDGQHLTIPAP